MSQWICSQNKQMMVRCLNLVWDSSSLLLAPIFGALYTALLYYFIWLIAFNLVCPIQASISLMPRSWCSIWNLFWCRMSVHFSGREHQNFPSSKLKLSSGENQYHFKTSPRHPPNTSQAKSDLVNQPREIYQTNSTKQERCLWILLDYTEGCECQPCSGRHL